MIKLLNISKKTKIHNKIIKLIKSLKILNKLNFSVS